jgi:hypothetical protein
VFSAQPALTQWFEGENVMIMTSTGRTKAPTLRVRIFHPRDFDYKLAPRRRTRAASRGAIEASLLERFRHVDRLRRIAPGAVTGVGRLHFVCRR